MVMQSISHWSLHGRLLVLFVYIRVQTYLYALGEYMHSVEK